MQEKQEKKNRPWGFGCEGSRKENWNTNREKQLKVKKEPTSSEPRLPLQSVHLPFRVGGRAAPEKAPVTGGLEP